MSSLRRACAQCTASKRKCIVQMPKCVRCSLKNLECVYDLEPLNAPPTASEQLITYGLNLCSPQSSGVCIMKSVKRRAPNMDPAICTPGQNMALVIIRLGFDTVPDCIRAGKPASFVHPNLKLLGIHNHLTAIVREEANGVSCEGFKLLITIDIKAVSSIEVLVALQALLVHLAVSAFSPFRPEQEEAERSLRILSEWTQILLACVDAGMPRSQSPWQNWLLGESVRRTILMAYVLNLSITSYLRGYCSNWLLMESLPFDARPGLWMAKSPQAWIAAAHARCGEEVGERLNSFHEFAEASNPTQDLCGDVFLSLLVFSHNGISHIVGTKPKRAL